MTDKPNSLLLEGLFLRDSQENPELKSRVIRAWGSIHRIGKIELGKKNCIALEPYTQWVRLRATQIRMPYSHHDPLQPLAPKTSYIPPDDKEKLQATLEVMRQERDSWKNKAHVLEIEKEVLQKKLHARDEEDSSAKRQKTQEDLFSSLTVDEPYVPQPIETWRGIIDDLVDEQARMQRACEERIQRLQEQLHAS